MRSKLALACLSLGLTADGAQGQVVRAHQAPQAIRAGASASANPCLPAPLALPVWSDVISLGGAQACGGSEWPYSARHTPDGSRLYVPLFGGLLGNGGCSLARLDPVTLATLAVIPTGESPEEVAFVTHPDGSLRLGFVTNSSSSTVTVFDAADTVVATVAIPAQPGGAWPTAFPFGLAVSSDQRHVFVGTADGQGLVHALDTWSLTLDPSRSVALGPDHSAARLAVVGELLVIPATRSLPGSVGSVAKLVTVVPGQPATQRELVLASASSGQLFPSPQDCAVDCDGTVWIAGFDLGAQVYGIDPRTHFVRAVVPTVTQQPDGKFQALGLSPDGLLVVGDFYTHELALIDARRRRWIATIDPATLPVRPRFPQDIEFSPRWPGFLVPCALGGELARFDR